MICFRRKFIIGKITEQRKRALLISITGAHAKAKANAAQGLPELIEIAAGKKFLLVILLYFSKHFYVIMKTEL